MSEANPHLVELADRIGPRPAATDAEAMAADYIQSVFEARGLDVERQEFLTPRSYFWSYVIYYVLAAGAAALTGWYPLPAFALALVTAAVLWLDLDTRWGLGTLMPKGPSQNVIARRPADVRRGEKVKKVVLVAHYDSAYSSLIFSPALVKNFYGAFTVMKWSFWAIAALALAASLPFEWVESAQPWLWYATLAVGAYLFFVPLPINLHAALFTEATEGANDNASGVAVLLEALARMVPESGEAPTAVTGPLPVVEVPPDEWFEEDEADERPADEGVLDYAPAAVPDHLTGDPEDDLEWSEAAGPPGEGQTAMDIPEDAFSGLTEPAPPPDGGGSTDDGLGDWLGVDDAFDVREEGRRIGSWERFDGDDDGESGSKGGEAGLGRFDDPDYASSEAARIRQQVTSGVSRGLLEREVWFVATGAEEVGTRGMIEFLKEHGEELADAFFINIDNVGAGNLSWVTREGMALRYSSDRRLMSAARRVAREQGFRVKGRAYRGLSTDATPALARRFRAMSVMAFDINGRLPNWHWKTDTVDHVVASNIGDATDFVVELVKEI